MKIASLTLPLISLFLSCNQDNSESVRLKEQVSVLELKVDSLTTELASLKQANEKQVLKKKPLKIIKRNTSPTKIEQFELKPPDNSPIAKDSLNYSEPSSTSQIISNRQRAPETSNFSVQCIAITKSGDRCKRMTATGIYCWQHMNYVQKTESSYTSKTSSSKSSSSSSSGGTVYVKGYNRKDGTYVSPHTRSAPKRKN